MILLGIACKFTRKVYYMTFTRVSFGVSVPDIRTELPNHNIRLYKLGRES
jgi:hypothetical protein